MFYNPAQGQTGKNKVKAVKKLFFLIIGLGIKRNIKIGNYIPYDAASTAIP